MGWTMRAVALLGAALIAGCSGVVTGDPDDEPAGADAAVEPAADAAAPALRDDGRSAGPWRDRLVSALDSDALAEAFAAAGYQPPPGLVLYGARIEPGAEQPAMVVFDFGPGAFSTDFWPASTIKLLSAIGALHQLRERGFTGEAEVSFAGIGDLGRLRDLYGPSIRVSDNLAYTRTLQIAGLAFMNDVFLTGERGFDDTVLTRSYVVGVPSHEVPEMTLREGVEVATVPARSDDVNRFGCVGNCTSLYELVEGLRRVLLDAELPARQRFDLAASDIAELRSALCDAPSFFEAGAVRALGPVSVCNKSGWVPDLHYLDHALIEIEATGERLLLAAALPWSSCGSDGACRAMLAEVAEHALPALRARPGVPVQDDGGVDMPVQLDDDGSGVVLTIDAPGASQLELWIGRAQVATAEGSGRFAIALEQRPGAGEVVTLRARAGEQVVAQRTVSFAPR